MNRATLRACDLASFVAIGWLLVQGSSYYLTPLMFGSAAIAAGKDIAAR